MDMTANLDPNKRVPTFAEFIAILDAAGEDDGEFTIVYERPDGKLIWESAPFDSTDPMSYAIAEVIFANPRMSVYKHGD